jgi:hypothetical protein
MGRNSTLAPSSCGKTSGDYLGWGRESEWHRDERNLLKLYDYLLEHDGELLGQVDLASDPTSRQEWVQVVANLVNPDSPVKAAALADETAEVQIEPVEESRPAAAAASVAASVRAKPSAFGSIPRHFPFTQGTRLHK